jgi:L-aspartate oxidase
MQFDVVVIGSGLAGMTVALNLPASRRVALVSKDALAEGSSRWAQGGIAAVLDSNDSIESHVEDTLIAGAGLSDPNATRMIAEGGPNAIQWLRDMGVHFSPDALAEFGLHLTREGGHAHRRIVHVADATGRAVTETLAAQVRQRENIVLLEHHCAIDLITSGSGDDSGPSCQGVYLLDTNTDQAVTLQAEHVVLATGGAGKVYLYTTNPDSATGDGVAMAWRAGARVANMEFMQFHPTCLYHPHAKSFLISEAVRGEGGILQLPNGFRFMPQHDERAELAPRDVVARAIDFEMKKHGVDCVYLDISFKGEAFIEEHFPTIRARCQELGIDITKEPIPVVPAAHYTCGGVVTDLIGQTDIANLYAVGETAYTGLHGANRLASNSLLECLVLGQATAQAIAKSAASKPQRKVPAWDESRVSDPDEQVVLAHNWEELRRLMWNYVGIVRTNKRLARASHRLNNLREEISEYYGGFKVSRDLLELRNLVDVAALIVESALARHESRGLHYTRDYPETLEAAVPTILTPEHALEHATPNPVRLRDLKELVAAATDMHDL